VKETEIILAHGHKHIQSTHKTTFEITKEEWLTKRGDCIIAVGADKGVMDLSKGFKEALRNSYARVTITIEAGGIREVVTAFGDPNLTCTHPNDLVVRKSNYVCSRTVAVRADKAAKDLSRQLVENLRNPHQIIKIILTVTTP